MAAAIIARCADAADRSLLGGLTPAAFLRRHWQKRALLVREAIPGFGGLLSRAELFALAAATTSNREWCCASGGRWSLRARTVSQARISPRCPRADGHCWCRASICICAAADALLRRFAFIPYARLDDLMVSYAAPGGGVGAAFRFVRRLPAAGRAGGGAGASAASAIWRCEPGLPLKMLARFRPTASGRSARATCCTCRRDHAHDGVAVDACTTYSIGFRAPSTQRTRDGVSRLAARRHRARRPLRRSGSAAVARAGAHRRGDASAVRARRSAASAGTGRRPTSFWAAI